MSGLSQGRAVPAGNKYKHSILVTAFFNSPTPFYHLLFSPHWAVTEYGVGPMRKKTP